MRIGFSPPETAPLGPAPPQAALATIRAKLAVSAPNRTKRLPRPAVVGWYLVAISDSFVEAGVAEDLALGAGWLAGGPSTVNHEELSRDVPGGVRGEEHHRPT